MSSTLSSGRPKVRPASAGESVRRASPVPTRPLKSPSVSLRDSRHLKVEMEKNIPAEKVDSAFMAEEREE